MIGANAALDRRHREFCSRFHTLALHERERPGSVCRRAHIYFSASSGESVGDLVVLG
jgi:hypothetical protein